ncbi:MAG: hypothetical protein LBS68_01995 [Puniceicoccales bacterium]|jgi:hypothetical protein|nr:hypothetical protein [Puniceicoccales bacterium]
MNISVKDAKTPLQVGFFEIFSETSSVHSVVKTHPVACASAILSDILLAFTILVPIVAMISTRIFHGQWVFGWFVLRMCASHFLESEKKEVPPPKQNPPPPQPENPAKSQPTQPGEPEDPSEGEPNNPTPNPKVVDPPKEAEKLTDVPEKNLHGDRGNIPGSPPEEPTADPSSGQKPPSIPPDAPLPGGSGGGNGPLEPGQARENLPPLSEIAGSENDLPKKEERPGNSKPLNPNPGQPGKPNASAPRRGSLPSKPSPPVDDVPPRVPAAPPPLSGNVAAPSNPTPPQPPGGQVPAPPNVASSVGQPPPPASVAALPPSASAAPPPASRVDPWQMPANLSLGEKNAYLQKVRKAIEDKIAKAQYRFQDCGTDTTSSCAYCCMAHQLDPTAYRDSSRLEWDIRKFRNELVVGSLNFISDRILEAFSNKPCKDSDNLLDRIIAIRELVENHGNRIENQSIFHGVEVENSKGSKTRKFYDIEGQLTIDATESMSVEQLRADLQDNSSVYGDFIRAYEDAHKSNETPPSIACFRKLLTEFSRVRYNYKDGTPSKGIIYKCLVLLMQKYANLGDKELLVTKCKREIADLAREKMNDAVKAGVSEIIEMVNKDMNLAGALTLPDEYQNPNEYAAHPLKKMQSAMEAMEVKYAFEPALCSCPNIIKLLHNIAHVTNCENVYGEVAEFALCSIVKSVTIGVIIANAYSTITIYSRDGSREGFRLGEKDGEMNFSQNAQELLGRCDILVHNNASGFQDFGIHWRAVVKKPPPVS